MEKAEQTCELWIQAYPRSEMPHNLLSGAIYTAIGQYEKGVDEGTLLMFNYIAQNRLDEAKATYLQDLERKLNNPFFIFPCIRLLFCITMWRALPSR
jgi:eukaryotic-like serine/threonine-protein kinase